VLAGGGGIIVAGALAVLYVPEVRRLRRSAPAARAVPIASRQ
jgi:hypothetical protein